MSHFLAIQAGQVAILNEVRRINSKLDTLQITMDSTQSDLDSKLAELKTQIGETAQRVSDKLGSLNQASPTFNAEVADIQNDLSLLAAIAPAAQTANASSTPAPATPTTPAPVQDGATLDAHPEIVNPGTDPVGSNPANTDTTPQVQKDAAPVSPASTAPVNQPVDPVA